RYREAALLATVGIGWLGSFTASYRASQALLGPSTTMFAFWAFAFLPVAPLSAANLARSAGILLEVFVNPLNLVGPNWPRFTVLVPLSLMAAGCAALLRRSWQSWAILVSPAMFAVIAAAMQRYPIHGRLILELVPALLVMIAAGTEVVRLRNGTGAQFV